MKMDNYKDEIKSVLDENPQYRSSLFKRGYLITDAAIDNTDKYPFYNNWTSQKIKNYNLLVHKEQTFCVCDSKDFSAVMIGHAYNPFTMEYKDEAILSDCLDAYIKDKAKFWDTIDSLTGIFVIYIFEQDKFIAVQDCVAIRSCYFGTINGNLILTSHPQLVADLFSLEMDKDVELLFSKRFYSIAASYLPGNITPYKELKRLGANTYLSYSNGNFSFTRFYPLRPHREIDESEYESNLNKITDILHKNIELCSKKWERPAISMTGGMDSKTTLSCTNGLYDKFRYYTFHSKPQEVTDCNAAREICQNLGLEHLTYPIPDNNEDVADFDFLKKILNHNTAYVSQPADHETRKFITMSKVNDFDMELKSWVSEIGRAYWSRKHGIRLPAKFNERHYTIFQKRYIGSPYLIKWADRLNREYLREIQLYEHTYNYEHQDLFLWEVRYSAWGTIVDKDHEFMNPLTMPFNNRKLMDLFLEYPRDMRTNDVIHDMILKKMNPDIVNMNISVHNDYLSKKRIMMERIYYYWRMMFFRSKL